MTSTTPLSRSRLPSGPVGVLGIGAMGAPMAQKLLDAGCQVWLNSRRRKSAAALLLAGAHWADTVAELVEHTEILIVALPKLEDLEALLGGPDGILASSSGRRLTIVLTSTCSPRGVRDLAGRLAIAPTPVDLVDAPVSGGVEGARRGLLSIMVGHDGPLAAEIDSLLSVLGKPVLLGPVGAGQVAKACNQLIVSATALAIAESIAIAERAGISVSALLPLLNGGYAGSALLTAKLPKLVAEDYSPDGKATYMLKDLRFASEEAHGREVRAPLLEASLAQFEALVAAGLGEADLAVTRRFVEIDSPVGIR